ncbi:MAG: HTTM domain-containing protein [Myxococcota bacterium]|nr:HTTM domain-containing protein [Myxococcota bacterium]
MTEPRPSLWDRYWFSSDERALNRPLRSALFLLLGFDAFTQISHLSRYGAGNFNVSHFPALDGLIPAPEARWMLGLVLLQVVLAVLVAFGVQLRRTLPALFALYSVGYFWSQLDSYQHHYLVVVILGLLAGAVWVDGDGKELPPWAPRLLRAQIAIVYFWTAVTKAEPQWLSGEVMSRLLAEQWARDLVSAAGDLAGIGDSGMYAVLAWSVLFLEFGLAIGFLWPEKLRWPTLILGVALHVGIEASGFKIGNFSYIMVTLYLLMLPPRLFEGLPRPQLRQARPEWLWLAGALAVSGVVLILPLEARWLTASLAFAGTLAAIWGSRGAVQVAAPFVAAALIGAFHLGTDQLRDYYRYMGGDARMRAEWETATYAYEQVVDIDPSYFSGTIRLADLYVKAGRFDEARSLYERAGALEPDNPVVQERLRSLPGL